MAVSAEAVRQVLGKILIRRYMTIADEDFQGVDPVYIRLILLRFTV